MIDISLMPDLFLFIGRKMELIDYLTPADKELIKSYIETYAECTPVDINKSLFYWNKNKRKMFKALGNKLRVKIPIKINTNEQLFSFNLQHIYQPPFSYFPDNLTNHSFILCVEEYFSNVTAQEKEKIRIFFQYAYIKTGIVGGNYYFQKEGEKVLKIPYGTKIIKAIQKFLKYYNFPFMDRFEDWRNAISNLTTSKDISANLVFSIHPIDFLTLSDNACGWHSCMSWMSHGGYSSGVIEMMNSNMVVVAYLESEKPFYFNNYKIPNKSWRVLMYVHKNILLEGKSYPYYNKDVALVVLDNLRKLLYNNIGWKYQYINQEYEDDRMYYDNNYARSVPVNSLRKKNKHCIFIYTNGMYNDLIKDHEYVYWCCRNWVPKTIKINASGIGNCMFCGKPMQTQSMINETLYEEDLDCGREDKYCLNCREEFYCTGCDRLVGDKEILEVNYWYYRGKYFAYPEESFLAVKNKRICEECFNKEYRYYSIDSTTHEKIYLKDENLLDFIKNKPKVKLYKVGEDI